MCYRFFNLNRILFFRFAKIKFKAALRIAKTGLIPQSTFGALGQLFAALSIFALLRYSLKFGLSETFEIVFSVYIRAVDLTIGQLDPLIKSLIAYFHNLFSWHLHFSENWRYIFVVLQMLFVRDAGTAFSDGRFMLAIVRALVGSIIAVASSLCIAVPSGTNPTRANMIIAITPPTALLVYDIVMYLFMSTIFFSQVGVGELLEPLPRLQFCILGLKRSLTRFGIVGFPSLSIFVFPYFWSTPAPAGGIVAIVFGTLVNAAYWIEQGSSYARRVSGEGIKFKNAFLASESGRH